MQHYLVCQKIELVSDFFSTSDSLQLLLLLLFSWILVIILKHTLTHILIIHHELFTEEDKKLFRFRIRSNAIKIKWGKLCSHLNNRDIDFDSLLPNKIGLFWKIWGIFGLKNTSWTFLEAIGGCCGTQILRIILGIPKI